MRTNVLPLLVRYCDREEKAREWAIAITRRVSGCLTGHVRSLTLTNNYTALHWLTPRYSGGAIPTHATVSLTVEVHAHRSVQPHA